jgi:hypothetical protein
VPRCPTANLAQAGKKNKDKRQTRDTRRRSHQALSTERFARYLAWAGGDRARALDLYTLNTRLSKSLYITMQMLEVALRDRIHTVRATRHGEEWFRDPALITLPHQHDQVAKATEDVRNDGKDPTPGRIVAALTFSYWTSRPQGRFPC